MFTRTDRVVTRSMTKKKVEQERNNNAFIAFHRSALDTTLWSPVFHYGMCDEYHDPCRCCLALLFRKEIIMGRTRTGVCSCIACPKCLIWKNSIPYSDECCY